MPPSNPSKTERKHARKKRKLEERQNSYTQITDWNGDLPSITAEAPAKARITNRYTGAPGWGRGAVVPAAGLADLPHPAVAPQ